MSTEVRDRLSALLSGRYEIERDLGEGGMATVYLAQDLKHRRKVAIKVLKANVAASLATDRFLREIEIAANLSHPHIVPLFDSGGEDDLLYYVMPFVDGESLRALLDRDGPLSLDNGLRLTREIASALANAHRHGIVHRDIKPENILLTDGIAVVADFGISRAISAAAETGGSLTQSGFVLGTPHYMSPEQATGEAVDGRSDIYSLACLLFELLSGRPPFPGANTVSIIAAHVATQPPRITRFCPKVPEAVADVIMQALSKLADDRPATALRFAEALSAAAMTPAMAGATKPAGPSVAKNNLPAERARLIGREEEIAACSSLLRETRLLTLTGIGGSGKTRLGLAISHLALADFPDGVWFVDLAPLSEPGLLAGTVTSVMGLPEVPGQDQLDALCRYAAGKAILLMLDNCEHLIEATSAIADRLLSETTSLTILATSREGLSIGGERIVAVRPLALPSASADADVSELSRAPSVELFRDRAAAASSGFTIDETNAAAVSEICRRLDGIPLAIELAAARTKVLTVEQIRSRLDDRFRLLSGSSRGVLPRHQTLTATIQWSYESLSAEEKKVFRMFSIFSGGWTLNAASGLCGDEADEFAVLDYIGHLMDKSLVYVERAGPADETRYRVLETVRQYGFERLVENGEATQARDRHLAVFSALAEAGYAERVSREDFWTPRLEAEHDNLRTALETARQTSPNAYLQLAGALGWFWQARSHLIEGRRHLASALAAPGEASPQRARALWGMGLVVAWQGNGVESMQYMEQAIEIWRAAGDLAEVSLALESKGWAQAIANDYDAAEATLIECVRIQTEREDPVMLNRAQVALAQVKVALSKVEEARALANRIIEFSSTHADLRNEHFGWHFLADCALIENDCRESLRLYQKSLGLAQAMGDRLETSFEVQGVGMSLAGLGRPVEALHLVSAAKAEWSRLGVDLHLAFWDELLDRYLGRARSSIDSGIADNAWRDGSKIPFDQAVNLGLAASEKVESQG